MDQTTPNATVAPIPALPTTTAASSQLPTRTPLPLPSPSLTKAATATLRPTATAVPTSTPTLPPLPTLPPACGTIVSSHPGSQTLGEAWPVLAQGEVVLCAQVYVSPDGPQVVTVQEALLDLDAGVFGELESDVEFEVSGGSMLFYGLLARNQASIDIWSLNGLTLEHARQPTAEECRNRTNPFANDNEPEYACLTTSEGNISRLKVEEYNPLGKAVLAIRLSFVTWSPP